MKLQDQNIMFFTRTMNLGGTENVVLQLCEIFKPLVNRIIVCSCGGINEEKLRAMGISHYTIGDPEVKSPQNIFRNCLALRHIVHHEHITVIHTHHRMAAFYIRILGLHRVCRFIHTSHNTFSDKRLLTRFALKKASLIACGDMVRKNLSEIFGLNHVTVIHNAVKPFREKIVPDANLQAAKEAGNVLIGNIGRLTKQKGMQYFLEAVPSVLTEHPDARFFIIGSGEDEATLRKSAYGMPVSFLGYRSDIQNLMSQLDLIVLSSLWEGLPLTPIEAFSVGKTVVATGVDGTLEIVQHGKNGLLVSPGDSDSLAAQINWLLSHPEERIKLEAGAQETFTREFTFDKLAQSYIDYYRSL